jgi:hypothetical protein
VARRAWRHRLHGALSLTGFGLLFAGCVVGWTAAMQSQAASATEPPPPPNSLPLHNATAGPADGCPGTGGYWHFVLTPNGGGSSFASIVLDVDGETFTFAGFPPIIENGSQTDNVFVPVPTGHAVTGLETSGSYATYMGATPSDFVLSGVCAGDGQGGSPSTTSTTDQPTTTSTTDQPTTTSTTVAPTTTSTTDQPTTTSTTDQPTTTSTTVAPTTTSTTVAPTTASTTDVSSTTTTSTTDGSSIPSTTVAVVPPASAQPEVAAASSAPTDAPVALASTGASTNVLTWIAAGLIAIGIVALALGSRSAGLNSER